MEALRRAGLEGNRSGVYMERLAWHVQQREETMASLDGVLDGQLLGLEDHGLQGIPIVWTAYEL